MSTPIKVVKWEEENCPICGETEFLIRTTNKEDNMADIDDDVTCNGCGLGGVVQPGVYEFPVVRWETNDL